MKLLSIILLTLCLTASCSSKDDNPVGAGGAGAGAGEAGEAEGGGSPTVINVQTDEINDLEAQLMGLMQNNLNSFEPTEVGMQKVIHKASPVTSYIVDAESGEQVVDFECVFNKEERHTILSINPSETRILEEVLDITLSGSTSDEDCNRMLDNMEMTSTIMIKETINASNLYAEVESLFLGTETSVIGIENLYGEVYQVEIVFIEDNIVTHSILNQYDMSQPYFFSEINQIVTEQPGGKFLSSELIMDTAEDVVIDEADLAGVEEISEIIED